MKSNIGTIIKNLDTKQFSVIMLNMIIVFVYTNNKITRKLAQVQAFKYVFYI